MERIKRNLTRIQNANPNLSSLVCFNLTMNEGKFSNIDISQAFRALVDKSDYPRKHYDELVEQAIELNKPL